MKEHDQRVAIRLPAGERQKAEDLVRKGKFKSFSQVIRTALEELFANEGDA